MSKHHVLAYCKISGKFSVQQFVMTGCYLIWNTEVEVQVTYMSAFISVPSMLPSQSGSVVLIPLLASPNPMN